MNEISNLKQNTLASDQATVEILAILFKDTTKSFIVAMCIALLLVVMLNGNISTNNAAMWLCLIIVAYTLRVAVVHQHAKHQFKFSSPQIWLNRFRLTTAICGLTWGAAGFLLFPEGSITSQAMLGLFIAGICAGALINYSIDKITALLFTSGAFLLSAPAFIQEQNKLSNTILVVVLVFIVYVAIACKRLAQGILDNLSLRIEADEQKKQIISLSERQNLHLEHTPMGVIEWDANLMVTTWNKACETIFGYVHQEAVGKHISYFIPKMLNTSNQLIIDLLMHEEENRGILKEVSHKSGTMVYSEWFNTMLKNEQGNTVGMASLVQDKTDFITSQEKIHQLAYFDSLTQLPNRGLLLDRINQTLASTKRNKSYNMIAFIDLDHFKAINDIKGHNAGDYLLKIIAQRLQDNIRQQDTAARLGGDEFVLVLSNIGSTQQEAEGYSKKIIEKISRVINTPVEFDDYQHQCSASIGICLFNDDRLDATELLRRADVSMYISKKQGRNTYQFYDDAQQPDYEYQLKLKHDLNHALTNKQFELYLQGQYDSNSKITGAEVLLRWQHPELGMVMPNDFIPLAEETGAIVPIGFWILKQACTLLKKWQDNQASASLIISVNVSAIQFNHPDFVRHVEEVIQLSDCDPTKLCLELTESSVVTHIEESIAKMHRIKAMGVSLSIDDFGTGYSSLSALKNLPLNELKIDRSFVKDFTKDPVDLTIVQTILQMGKNLNLRVVAEGVETESQMGYLSNYGCEMFQGYFFAKPCPVNQFEQGFVTDAQPQTKLQKKPKAKKT